MTSGVTDPDVEPRIDARDEPGEHDEERADYKERGFGTEGVSFRAHHPVIHQALELRCQEEGIDLL